MLGIEYPSQDHNDQNDQDDQPKLPKTDFYKIHNTFIFKVRDREFPDGSLRFP